MQKKLDELKEPINRPHHGLSSLIKLCSKISAHDEMEAGWINELQRFTNALS